MLSDQVKFNFFCEERIRFRNKYRVRSSKLDGETNETLGHRSERRVAAPTLTRDCDPSPDDGYPISTIAALNQLSLAQNIGQAAVTDENSVSQIVLGRSVTLLKDVALWCFDC
jgi:hypothetical protein